MDRAEEAVAKHRNGYNCCQAVACVFADKVGIDESLLYRMGEGFGAGMGTTQGVCGAMSGAAMLAGLVHSDGNTEMAGQTKAKTTRIAGIMQKKFTEQAKALMCKDIKTGNGGKAESEKRKTSGETSGKRSVESGTKNIRLFCS